MKVIRKLWTGINPYLAGLDSHHPVPTPENCEEKTIRQAREIEKHIETIQRATGDKERTLNDRRRFSNLS